MPYGVSQEVWDNATPKVREYLRSKARTEAVHAYNYANGPANAQVMADQGVQFGANGEIIDVPGGGGGTGIDYYDSEARGEGGGYSPDPALVEALSRLDFYGAQAGQQINDAEQAWQMRLEQLRRLQSEDAAAAGAQIKSDNAAQTDSYNRAVDPITADLQAQGFSASPIQQQAVLDQQRLTDYGQRQEDLTRRFSEIQNRSIWDRGVAGAGQMAGARTVLANNLAMMRAELEGQIAGGGGGGGYGGGGGGGGGDAPLSILKALAEANTPLANPLNSVNYTGNHQGFVNKTLGRINDDLSNIGSVKRQFVNQARKKDLNHGGFVKRVKKQVFKPLRKAAPKYQQAKAKKNVAAEYVNMWGQS
jgi:hypothetical protein